MEDVYIGTKKAVEVLETSQKGGSMCVFYFGGVLYVQCEA